MAQVVNQGAFAALLISCWVFSLLEPLILMYSPLAGLTPTRAIWPMVGV